MLKSVIGLFAFTFIFGTATAQSKTGPWSLEECISHAMSHHVDVRQSTLDLETAKAAQMQAKMAVLPTARLGASHASNSGRSIDPFSNQPITRQFQTTDVGLNAGLTVFNGLQVQHTIRQETLGLKAGQQELQQTQNNVALNVALAYLAILQNEELLTIATRQVSTSKTQLERANKLVDAGSMAAATLADLQVQAGNDELERINALNNVNTAKLNLQQLMNLPATRSFEVQKINVDGLAIAGYEKAADAIYNIAEQVQPSIIGADLRVKSAHKGVQAAKGTLLPSIGLFGYVGSNYSSAVPTERFVANGTGYTTEEVASKNQYILVNNVRQPIYTTEQRPNGSMQDFYYFDQLNFNLRNTFGVSLSIPILNSWQARTRISNAIINRKRAEFLADNSRIQLRQNIEQAYTNLQAAQDRFQASLAQAEASAVAYTAAQKRFENGSVHFVDLNLAKTNYDRAQMHVVRNRYEYVFRKKILDFYQNKPLTLLE